MIIAYLNSKSAVQYMKRFIYHFTSTIVDHHLFHEWWLLKQSSWSINFHCDFLFSKSSYKQLIFTLLELVKTNLQGISIPTPSSLQWCLLPVTLMHIFLPRARKYQDTLNYLQGKWLTISLLFMTLTANLCIALLNSCSAWSFSPTAGFQTYW